ncbi:MAG: hypothetical protein ACXVZX_07480 [Terriglobales bacterium]
MLVTNDAADFHRLYRKLRLHPGLLIIVAMVVPEIQRDLLKAPLR